MLFQRNVQRGGGSTQHFRISTIFLGPAVKWNGKASALQMYLWAGSFGSLSCRDLEKWPAMANIGVTWYHLHPPTANSEAREFLAYIKSSSWRARGCQSWQWYFHLNLHGMCQQLSVPGPIAWRTPFALKITPQTKQGSQPNPHRFHPRSTASPGARSQDPAQHLSRQTEFWSKSQKFLQQRTKTTPQWLSWCLGPVEHGEFKSWGKNRRAVQSQLCAPTLCFTSKRASRSSRLP